MKKTKKSTVELWLVLLAVLLGAGITAWKQYDIPAGSSYGPKMQPALVIDSDGTVKERTYGFPLSYKDKTVVVTKDPEVAGFAGHSYEEQGLSYTNLVLNILFWYGLLFTLRSYYKKYKKQ